MKKLTRILVAALVLCLLATSVFAAAGAVQKTLTYRNIRITLDGETLTPTDAGGKATEPFIMDDSVYLPVRAISEALGCEVSWDDAASAVRISTEAPTLLYKFLTDITYTDIITDPVQDKYFKEGSALAGVEALLDAGRCYVNGFQIPAAEADCGDAFVIMGYDKLYKTENGWAAENNKRTGTNFADARLGMVEALSRTSGLPVYLYDTDGDGYTDKINFSFYAVALVDSLVDNGDGTMCIDRGDFALTKTKLDVNDVRFPAENVDSTIREGDFAMFWEDAQIGWCLQREIGITGKLTYGADHQYYVFNGEKIMDGMHNPKASINVANRPGQYTNAHLAFGLEDMEVTFWVTPEGSVASGFTSNENAAPSLEKAIAYCKALKADVAVSADGSGLASGKKWVTAEDMAAYDAAIAAAEAVLADTQTKNSALDTQIYNLFTATWGTKAKIEQIREGTIPGGFLAALRTVK